MRTLPVRAVSPPSMYPLRSFLGTSHDASREVSFVSRPFPPIIDSAASLSPPKETGRVVCQPPQRDAFYARGAENGEEG